MTLIFKLRAWVLATQATSKGCTSKPERHQGKQSTRLSYQLVKKKPGAVMSPSNRWCRQLLSGLMEQKRFKAGGDDDDCGGHGIFCPVLSAGGRSCSSPLLNESKTTNPCEGLTQYPVKIRLPTLVWKILRILGEICLGRMEPGGGELSGDVEPIDTVEPPPLKKKLQGN